MKNFVWRVNKGDEYVIAENAEEAARKAHKCTAGAIWTLECVGQVLKDE